MTAMDILIYLPIFVVIVIKTVRGGSLISIKNINIGSFRG